MTDYYKIDKKALANFMGAMGNVMIHSQFVMLDNFMKGQLIDPDDQRIEQPKKDIEIGPAKKHVPAILGKPKKSLLSKMPKALGLVKK